ncbi:MAG: recombinase family protein [Gammaproteobacteria bacterium]
MAVYGYARVSTDEQNLDLQIHALNSAGCERIFRDEGVSAVAETRPAFEAMLAALQSGDTLLVWKNDRAFRCLRDAILTIERFEKLGVALRSMTEFIDTSTPVGRAMFYILNVFAELEREMICERTRAGLDAARRKGKRLGRRPKLTNEHIAWARESLDAGEAPLRIARILDVSSRTLSRALERS